MICMFNAIHFCLPIHLKILEINVLKYMNLILLIFFCTRISMASLLKKDKVEVELLADIDKLLMIEKGTRDRI